MTRSPRPCAPPRRNFRWTLAGPVLVLAVLALPIYGGPSTAPSSVAGPSIGAHAAPTSAAPPTSAPVAARPTAAPAHAVSHPAAVAFNPPCYPVYSGPQNNVCVSIENPGEPDIIPTGLNRTSPVMPDANVSIPLVVKSENWLNFSTGNTPTSGPHSPIALNVSGTLWNGDPYFSQYDDSIWHAPGNTWWQTLPDSSNTSYPHQYLVNITARGSSGTQLFFAGEQITWWIYLVFNTNNVSFSTHEGPHLTFTYAGAWPYSPYPGSPHFGGPAATDLDVNITATPRVPNWNDSIAVTVNTTPADVAPYNATIGACLLDFVEVYDGVVLVNTSLPFNVSVTTGGVGNYTTSVRIPSAWAQVEGALASYRIWITDTAKPGDQVVTPWTNYTVGGNGTFLTGIFSSDLILTMTPASVLLDQVGAANLTPGQPLYITLSSRNPTSAILASQVEYSVAYPLLKETLTEKFYMHRESSTVFQGAIPGLPVDTIVNFTIYAWDFSNAVEQSENFSYNVDSFTEFVGPLQGNQAFFYVYVYDNGSSTWVQGATVQITGAAGAFNSYSNTTLGVAYANQTGTPYDPLVLQANTTYNVTVTDPWFVVGGAAGGESYGPISVQVVALPTMTAERPLASTANYVVLQQGDQILFYLNSTAVSTVSSPTAVQGSSLGDLGVTAIVGLLGAALAVVPIRAWWKQIKARRTAEEKRVTL